MSFFLNAQNAVMFKGKVTSTVKDVADVYIVNKTNKSTAITDDKGNFSIAVFKNDTLLFSSLKYRKKQIVITESILESSAVTVALEEFVNELNEVTVTPYNLSGNLGADVGTLRTAPTVTAGTLGLPNANAKTYTQSERLLKEAAGVKVTGSTSGLGAGGAVSLNPIINAITGRTKMLKKRVAVDRRYARTLRVRELYVDSLFLKDLRIPVDRINDFMYFCEVDDAFEEIADSHDQLRIWEFLIKKSALYRENNGLGRM